MKPLLLVILLCIAQSVATRGDTCDTPVPLNGIANKFFNDPTPGDGIGGWTDEGPENSLDAFPTGRIELEGIPFDIPADAPAVLAPKGRAWPDAPDRFVIPAAGLKGRTLFLLSAHAWQDGPVELVRLIVRYESGREDSLPIINLSHTGPWWNPLSLPSAPVAWRGQNRHGIGVGVYLTGYDLADEPLASITVQALPINGQFLILGLTVSEKPAATLPNRPPWTPVDTSRAGSFALAAPRDATAEALWQSIPTKTSNIKGRSLFMELDASLSAPSTEQAAAVARLLKSTGYTNARLAPLDPLLAWPDSSPVRNLLSTLKEAGVSPSVTLAGGRPYSARDEVAAFRDLDPRLGEVFFVDPAATKILHRDMEAFWKNPPVDGLSSSSILYDSGLLSYHIEDMPRPHRRMLMNRWAAWLREKYQDQAGLEKSWQVEGQTTPLLPDDTISRSKVELLSFSNILAASPRFRKRIADQVLFLDEIQRQWFLAQKDFADRTLPTALWSTTAWISPSWLRDIQTGLSASLDVVEDRAELMRPDLPEQDNNPLFLDVSPLSRSGIEGFLTPYYRVTGKPFVVWDSTGIWPGDRDFLRTLRTMAVAALQGWDGVLHRKLYSTGENGVLEKTGAVPGPALQNPAFVATLPLGRNLFLRGDLETAETILRRPLLLPSEIASKLPEIPSLTNPLGDTYPAWIPFVGRVEAGAGLPAWRNEEVLKKCHSGDSVTSITGQISLRPEQDLLEIRTPRSVAIAGTLGGNSLGSGSVAITQTSGYGVAYATSLDGEPLEHSGAILLGLVGRCNNSGTRLERSTEPHGNHAVVWKTADLGTAPILMDPVAATFSFSAAQPGRWSLTPLDAFGRPVADPSAVSSAGGRLAIPLDNRTHGAPLLLLRHESQ